MISRMHSRPVSPYSLVPEQALDSDVDDGLPVKTPSPVRTTKLPLYLQITLGIALAGLSAAQNLLIEGTRHSSGVRHIEEHVLCCHPSDDCPPARTWPGGS